MVLTDRGIAKEWYIELGDLKMGINGISTGYYQTGYTNNKTTKAATDTSFSNQMNNIARREYTVYMKTDDMLYSGGNGTGLSFYLKYAENSTEDDPIVVAKGVDENGEEFEQTIHINKINPNCATLVEMRALEAHLGVQKLSGFSSLPIGSTGELGLHDRVNFMDMFEKSISDFTKLNEHITAAYYRRSMQAYWDFMNRK